MSTRRNDQPVKHLFKHWFLYSLLIILPLGVGIGQTGSAWGDFVCSLVQTKVVVFAVLFAMSVTLSLEQLSQTAARPWGVLTASVISMMLFPLTVWGVVSLLPASPFSAGLLIMAAVPSTLASAAVWTRKAGGNDAVSLMTTLVTNGLCFIITPFWLWMTLGRTVPLDSKALAMRLLVIALLPMLLGQIVRLFRIARLFADQHRSRISAAAQLGILSIIFVGAIRSGPELAGNSRHLSIGSLILVWLVCLAIHLLFLVMSWKIARLIHCSQRDAIGVMFSGSQKTLPIAIDLATAPLLHASGISSLAILPPLIYHATQLIVDTLILEKIKIEVDSAG